MMKKIFLFFTLILLVSCTETDSEQAIDFFKKGNIKLYEENFSEAIRSYKLVLKERISSDTEAKTNRNIGISYYLMDDNKKALKHFNLVNKTTNSYLNHLVSADKALLNNKIKKAIKEYTLASKLNNDMNLGEADYKLSSIYFGDYGFKFYNAKKMLTFAKKSNEINENPSFKENLGKIYLDLEAYKDALLIFNELQKKYPAKIRYDFFKGQALYFSGNESSGIHLMKNAADRDIFCKKMWNEIVQED